MAMEQLAGQVEEMALQMQEQNALIASLRAKVDEKEQVCTFSTKAVCKQRIEQVKAKFQHACR